MIESRNECTHPEVVSLKVNCEGRAMIIRRRKEIVERLDPDLLQDPLVSGETISLVGVSSILRRD